MESAVTKRLICGEIATGVGMESSLFRGAGEKLAALKLDDRGMVRECSRASEALFKYRRSELVWRHVSLLLPQLAALELMQNGQLNPRLRFLCRIGRNFQAVTRDGEYFASELYFNFSNCTAHEGVSLIVCPAVAEHLRNGR